MFWVAGNVTGNRMFDAVLTVYVDFDVWKEITFYCLVIMYSHTGFTMNALRCTNMF